MQQLRIITIQHGPITVRIFKDGDVMAANASILGGLMMLGPITVKPHDAKQIALAILKELGETIDPANEPQT